jgi:hypothetical protein
LTRDRAAAQDLAMNRADPLRERVVDLLTGGGAHASVREGLSNFPAARCGNRVRGSPHTALELLEHMRIAQRDLLDYALIPGFESPPFPEGYWPKSASPPNERAWSTSLRRFFADQREAIAIARDRKRDLLAPLAHAPDTNLLLQLFLVASHNSYHLGQVMLLRRTLESIAREKRREKQREKQRVNRREKQRETPRVNRRTSRRSNR